MLISDNEVGVACVIGFAPRGPEVQVLDYQTQQMKLLPLIASAYALNQTGQFMLRHYAQGRSEIAQGNLEVMPEVRSTGSLAFLLEISIATLTFT